MPWHSSTHRLSTVDELFQQRKSSFGLDATTALNFVKRNCLTIVLFRFRITFVLLLINRDNFHHQAILVSVNLGCPMGTIKKALWGDQGPGIVVPRVLGVWSKRLDRGIGDCRGLWHIYT
ncbi:hypothetical protein HZ326_15200 [Fusarium oxysporum f. sp. albedinis]|nr:hypothetical protein HZ326_15200 [Fusarium oxysporum f. sp. albedinis]